MVRTRTDESDESDSLLLRVLETALQADPRPSEGRRGGFAQRNT